MQKDVVLNHAVPLNGLIFKRIFMLIEAVETQRVSRPFCSIIVYKSSQRSKKVRLQHFFAPDKSTITCLVYKKGCLYVGLVSGSVAVYSRSQGVCHTLKSGPC